MIYCPVCLTVPEYYENPARWLVCHCRRLAVWAFSDCPIAAVFGRNAFDDEGVVMLCGRGEGRVRDPGTLMESPSLWYWQDERPITPGRLESFIDEAKALAVLAS